MPSNWVYSVVQDSTGFIWMGTNNGLVRFDGDEFRAFRFDKRDTTSISSNNIQALLVDADQKIWIALANGVDVYSPDDDTFQHFGFKTKNGDSIKGRTVDIIEDRNKEVWIATADNGVFRFSKKDGSLQHYIHDVGNKNLLYHIQDIAEYEPRQLMIASDNGVGGYKNEEGYLSYANTINSTVLPKTNKYVYSIFKDQ